MYIEDLGFDILSIIIEYCNLKTRNNVNLLSTCFYNINHNTLIYDKIFNFKSFNKCKYKKPIKFKCGELSDMIILDYIYSINTLDLTNCNFRYNKKNKYINSKNITTLHLREYDSFLNIFINLEHLKIRNINCFDLIELNVFTKLKTLYISEIDIFNTCFNFTKLKSLETVFIPKAYRKEKFTVKFGPIKFLYIGGNVYKKENSPIGLKHLILNQRFKSLKTLSLEETSLLELHLIDPNCGINLYSLPESLKIFTVQIPLKLIKVIKLPKTKVKVSNTNNKKNIFTKIKYYPQNMEFIDISNIKCIINPKNLKVCIIGKHTLERAISSLYNCTQLHTLVIQDLDYLIDVSMLPKSLKYIYFDEKCKYKTRVSNVKLMVCPNIQKTKEILFNRWYKKIINKKPLFNPYI